MKAKLGILTLVLLLFPSLSTAQERDDYGYWNYIQINKAWKDASGSGGPCIGLRGEYRTMERFRTTDILFIRPTIGYRFNSLLKSELSYDYCRRASGLQHKFMFSTTLSLKSGPLGVSLREMYVRTLSTSSGAWSNRLRSKLNVQYTFPESGLKPYLAIEIFSWSKWDNTRHFVGMTAPLGSCCSADLFYLYLTTSGTPRARHVAGLGFTFDL